MSESMAGERSGPTSYLRNTHLIFINIILDEIGIWPIVHKIGPTQAQGWFFVD